MRLLFVLLPLLACAQTGLVPEKEDLPYIVQADNLIPTETSTAQEQKGKKDEITYFISSAASTAKTPLASPIFLLKAKNVVPEKLQLYKFDVRNGRREITFHTGKHAKNPEGYHLDVKHLNGDIYRIEVGDSLPNGEYSLTPEGSNDVYCFQVF
jgi:hypothetical protein